MPLVSCIFVYQYKFILLILGEDKKKEENTKFRIYACCIYQEYIKTALILNERTLSMQYNFSTIMLKSWKIPKGNSDNVNRRRTDNIMAKTKRTKGQTTIYKTLHSTLSIEQHEPH